MSPEISADEFFPSTSELTVKRLSSLFRNFSFPPCRAINPGISCGTNHDHCHEFPSTYSSLRWLENRGLNGDFQLPSAFTPRINPVFASKYFMYRFDRSEYFL